MLELSLFYSLGPQCCQVVDVFICDFLLFGKCPCMRRFIQCNTENFHGAKILGKLELGGASKVKHLEMSNPFKIPIT